MIKVPRRACPTEFHEQVEKPGAQELARLRAARGSLDGLASTELKPLWRAGASVLRDAYGWMCAYSAMRISKTTGQPTIDHFAPKSIAPEHAYSWDNYRLACHRMNSNKRDYSDVLDPWDIEDDWFELDLDTAIIRPRRGVDAAIATAVEDTLRRLKLNLRQEFVDERAERIADARSGDTKPAWVERNAPFIHRELVRQNGYP